MRVLSSSPRIAVFTKQLDAWRSGSGHHLNQIMQRILDLNDKLPEKTKIEFTFIHYKKSENQIYQRVRELIVPRNPLLSARVLRRERFDLVHYTPLTIFAPVWCVPNKKLATIHGVEQLLIPQFFGPLEMWHERHLVPLYARKMDGIFSVSQTTKAYMVKHYGVAEKTVRVAYNGVGPEFRPRTEEECPVLAEKGIVKPYIFHISRFSERKNPWVLLEAFARFCRCGPYAAHEDSDTSSVSKAHRLVCAGSGWDSEEVRTRAEQLGIGERLYCPGFIQSELAAQFMAGAEFFVFPSLAEGFGMPNAEAMAAGAPVLTTPAFAVQEIVGDAALVIQDAENAEELAAAMERMSEDKTLRETLREKGYKRAALFDWDRAAESLFTMYRDILNS